MNTRLRIAGLIFAALPVVACTQTPAPQSGLADPQATASGSQPKTALGRHVESALREARSELATQNISLNDGIRIGPYNKSRDHLPKAEISPRGDLLIQGKSVKIDPAQRALLVKYRGHLVALTEAVMEIGVKGADLGMQAAGEAMKGIFTGDIANIERRIEAEAREIEAEATKLCAQLPPMLATQQALAAALSAFKPYARMTEQDITDCYPQATRATVSNEIRENIRGRIRESVGSALHGSDAGANSPASALIDAVDAQRIEEVRRLVEQGADIDAAVLGDGTALIRASAHGDLVIVNELIRLGADVNQPARGDGNPLIAAAKRGHADVVARLVAAGADVNAVVAGDETPLINAARGGHLDVVTYLVEHGADVNKGVVADLVRWRSPLNQAAGDRVRDYLTSKGAVADRKS